MRLRRGGVAGMMTPARTPCLPHANIAVPAVRSRPCASEPVEPKWWLIALILFSLLAHVLVMLAFLLVGRHTPKWKELAENTPPPEVNLTLLPPPAPPPQRPEFIPTEPEPNVPPQKSLLISDNDSILKSHNRKSRKSDSLLPDVTGSRHASALREKPPSPQSKPQPATPPTPQSKQPPPRPNPEKPNQATKPAPPTPPQPHPSENPQPTPSQEVATKPAPPADGGRQRPAGPAADSRTDAGGTVAADAAGDAGAEPGLAAERAELCGPSVRCQRAVGAGGGQFTGGDGERFGAVQGAGLSRGGIALVCEGGQPASGARGGDGAYHLHDLFRRASGNLGPTRTQATRRSCCCIRSASTR